MDTFTTRRALPLLVAVGALLLSLWAANGTTLGATVTVSRGDSLSAIAARNGVSLSALIRANGIRDPNRVVAGRRLVLPGGGSSPAPSSGGTYQVRPGDSLSGIAARHGISQAALAAANGLTDPNRIVVGHRLVIPGGGSGGGAGISAGGGAHVSYRIRSGDTLGGIAARHGTTVSALAALNGIRDPGRITVGRLLTVPAGRPSVTAPTSSIEVASLLAQHAARYGVSLSLARAIAWQESRWTQSARSGVGAIGVMQLMPGTARWLGREVVGRRLDPTDLNDNIEGGVAYLAWLIRHGGSTRTAIAAYYQGLASLRQRGPYDDTKAYVASVLAFVGRV